MIYHKTTANNDANLGVGTTWSLLS